jgi:hypothetical protein
MERSEFKTRKEYPLKHLFDGHEFNVYEKNVINLSAGTPSENLLKKCCELFKEATDHLLVSDNCAVKSWALKRDINANILLHNDLFTET